MTLPKKLNNLNTCCVCKTLDSDLLANQLGKDPLLARLLESRPHLFSSTMVFISPDQHIKITDIINSIEKVIKLKSYQAKILEKTPLIARTDFGPKGVFMGYDFHLTEDGPKLIEINTNAGGGLLNVILARAQIDCCIETNFPEDTENSFIEMFMNEWHLQRGNEEFKTIAIIDENPESQYLYPEFQLFQKLFLSHGKNCIIADAQELKWEDGKLWHKDEVIDMVYNRLTDFYFEDPKNINFKNAYSNGNVVVTPAPYHHTLYANKMNFETLSQPQELDKLGVQPTDRECLINGIPRTESITAIKADDFWARRKNLFFKPYLGFGSKATYRGDKLTRKVWEEILKSQYVAQEFAPPSTRIIMQGEEGTNLKFDIRAYVYEGKIQLLAARLYSGQTTNFRTSGGGFAPVFVTPIKIVNM